MKVILYNNYRILIHHTLNNNPHKIHIYHPSKLNFLYNLYINMFHLYKLSNLSNFSITHIIFPYSNNNSRSKINIQINLSMQNIHFSIVYILYYLDRIHPCMLPYLCNLGIISVLFFH